MRETLVCTGKMAEQAYTFPETGVSIYSYEELCYYLSHHMIFYLHTLPEEELGIYLGNELGMERLSRQLARLNDPLKDQMKYFSALYREGSYYSEDEIREILDHYRSLKNAPVSMQYKWLGDQFCDYQRANMAAQCYQRALDEEDLGREMSGEVYHNLGVAQVRLFRFQDARISFLKAYQNSEDENSLFYYFCILVLTEDIQTATNELKEFDISDLVLESFQVRFANMSEEFGRSEEATETKRLRYLVAHERTDREEEEKEQMIRRLQADFRKEMYLDEKLFVTNLPVRYNIDEDKNQEG